MPYIADLDMRLIVRPSLQIQSSWAENAILLHQAAFRLYGIASSRESLTRERRPGRMYLSNGVRIAIAC